jgi:hypothetical protein
MDGSSFSVSGLVSAPAQTAPTVVKPQKAFAAAFAVMALALAGCASGLGANEASHASTGMVARVDDGAVVAAEQSVLSDAYAYTVRLRTGELVAIDQPGRPPIAVGTPVLVEYGAHARVIPQNVSIGY